MTETNNKPKRRRGRPKKYFTDEERKQADKGYVKNVWRTTHFIVAFVIAFITSKSKHLKSKRHIKNLGKM